MALILLIGPDAERASGIRTLLRGDGHDVVWHRGLRDWPTREREVRPEIVVATVETLEEVLASRAVAPRGFPAPLLWIEPDGPLASHGHHDERLVDRISTPFLLEELLGRVDALVRVRRIVQHRDAADEQPPRRGLRGRLAAFLGAGREPHARSAGPFPEVTARLAEWSDARDAFEPGHAERVMSCCAAMADTLGLSECETAALLRAAMLHDIGKVAVPVEILRQERPLDDQQRRLVRTHARRGAALVRALDRDETVAEVILLHHERPDGAGYHGRSGAEIPRAAAILAVAEVYDGLTNSRHGQRLARAEALERLQDLRGSVVDPDCADALVRTLERRRSGIPLSVPAN